MTEKVPAEAIVFDFDGTLVDSYLESLNTLYQLVHHRPLPPENISRLRGMTLLQLTRELHISLWRLPLLLGRLRLAMREHTDKVAMVPGIGEAIRSLSKGYKIFVQSSNSVQNVEACLLHFGLQNSVTAVYDSVGVFGKARNLRKLLHEQSLLASRVWYVGDEPRDIRAAKRVHLRSVAVTWGFSNIQRLERERPDALVFNPDELMRCFSNNYEN